jgi:thioredoxin-like negative regulator of GroEL
VNTMSSMPQRSHGVVLQELQRQGSPEARQIGGTLTARWGDPLGGFRMLNAALPTASPQAIEILRQFLDALQSLSSPEAKRAQGMTFEAMAARTSGVQASRFHLEAARVYSEAGDSESARRTLGALATDPNSPRGIASDAGATLVTVLLDEGNPQAASRELSKQKTALSLDQYQTLSRRLARAFALAGDLDRADSAMIGDSTVEGFDLSGRLQLFRGNLAEASALLRSAGPYAGSRDEATSRTALLALLQPMQEDTLPELGVALLHLEQRDTVKAVAELQALAGKLPANAGGAELWLQVGRLQRARGKNAEAERAFRAASSGGTEATTPAASLELARLLVSVGRRAESQTILEQLILEHPQSAVVPQARRLLDELRGAVPQT